jgi:hypothetical protein
VVKSVTVPGKCYAISDGDRQDNPISIYCHFLSCFLPPYWVSLSVFCARKLLLLKSLFLDKKLNQIDLVILTLIIFILRWGWWWRLQVFAGGPKGRDAFSIGWVAVAVVAASFVLAEHWHLLIRVSCLFGSDPKLTRCQ